MASLYFSNLVERGATGVEDATYLQLGAFHRFLKQAKEHMTRVAPTIGWAPLGVAVRVAHSGGIATEAARQEVEQRLRRPGTTVHARDGRALELLSVHPPMGVLVFAEKPPEGEIELRAPGLRPLRLCTTLVEDKLATVLAGAEGLWIELQEPADQIGADRLLAAFFEEDTTSVNEVSDDQRGRHGFALGRRIEVLGSDPERHALHLERTPSTPRIAVKPNTYVLECQLNAIDALQSRPLAAHRPLLRLFERSDLTAWPPVESKRVETWQVLADPSRPGTDEQRDFVQRALATPDFALLEGPPGSGKTTAIEELVLQLALEGKRVLLVASTHVAVDNVLERLKKAGGAGRDLLVVRIGRGNRVSDEVKPYCLDQMVPTELAALRLRLEKTPKRSRSQDEMLDALRSDRASEVVERVILDCAQLVCGTTIGVLKHPDVAGKVRRRSTEPLEPSFDVLILDEASKTPFAEFLVPALLARRWIIVGDRRQLSPYVEQAWVETSVETALPNEPLSRAALGQVLHDVFELRSSSGALIVAADDAELRAAYAAQIAATFPGELVVQLDQGASDPWTMGCARAVVGTPAQMAEVEGKLPLAIARVRLPTGDRTRLRRVETTDPAPPGDKGWSAEVAWRLVRDYELRLLPELLGDAAAGAAAAARYKAEVDALLPREGAVQDPGRVARAVQEVRRVALPSVLESLQVGFDPAREGHAGRGAENALNRGLPAPDLRARLVNLTYQHRMHPDISAFPREHIYKSAALLDSPSMAELRDLGWSRYRSKAVWIHVPGAEVSQPMRNPQEAKLIMTELRELAAWAGLRRGTAPVSVAVLTFYRGQERELRARLRQETNQRGNSRRFTFHDEHRVLLEVELCTVDRFQGHEADVVFLSFVRTSAPGFLNSPNRLNVAITRARCQLVMVGHWHQLVRMDLRAPLVASLAREAKRLGNLDIRY